jgi:transposase-like protein
MINTNRPPLASLACVNPECERYGQAGKQNLTVRKTYGKDEIRYLHCSCCGSEFSERKNTALWSSKIPETRAIDIAELISEGVSIKGTARKTRSHTSTVRRLALKSGQHAQRFHHTQAQQLPSQTLEMDERHGYVESKEQPIWDAVTIAPQSKFIVQLEVGPRATSLIEPLMRRSAERLANPQDLLLMTDGEATYRSLFPEIFGVPYFPPVKAGPGASPTSATVSLAP